MKQHPDELFREKLEQHSIVVPQNAWNRIEKKIPASRNTFFIWKVAAAILLLLVSIALLLPVAKSDQPTLLSHNTVVENQKSAEVKVPVITPVVEQKDVVQRTPNTSDQRIQKASVQTQPTLIKHPITSVESQESLLEEVTESLALFEVISQPVTPAVEEIAEVNSQTAAPEEASTIIVLTAAEVNTKYLLSPPAQATSETESTSSFRKLIDKAASFKNNTSGLAELRQKKNEMLALNTEKLRNRNEKNERNN